MAIFFSAATAAGAFGGLLARGIMEMRGRAGLSGWQWIFIIEGLLTFVVGMVRPVTRALLACHSKKTDQHVHHLAIIAYFVMQDYPATAKFLTQEERTEIQARLKRDRSSLADEFDIKYFWAAIKDWKIWVHMFITIGVYTGLYSYSLFLPTIINDLGTARTPEMAQLMTVPPYVVACIFCVGSGWYADKLGQRGLFMMGFMVVAYVVSRLLVSPPRKPGANGVTTNYSIIGLIMLMATSSSAVRYLGCFFLATGTSNQGCSSPF
jgi:MFS family permease